MERRELDISRISFIESDNRMLDRVGVVVADGESSIFMPLRAAGGGGTWAAGPFEALSRVPSAQRARSSNRGIAREDT